jgi:23S rRNA pseudouridine2605 synthase
MLERLQKTIAAAGLASRRKAEELIAGGHVEVNGQVVSQLGTKVDPEQDAIRVNGRLLHGPERKIHLMLHKPKGYVTTVTDPEGRPTVMNLVRGVGARLYPVGRLDYLSEGLLLLTNDGALAQQLTRASSHVAKTYMVKVSGKPDEAALDKLRAGVLLQPRPVVTPEGKRRPTSDRAARQAIKTAPALITLKHDAPNPWYEVTLFEGRNRQLRRMFEEIGHHVEKIKRIRYGSLELDIEPGQFRLLTPAEVSRLARSGSQQVSIGKVRPAGSARRTGHAATSSTQRHPERHLERQRRRRP